MIVTIDRELCVSCGACWDTCPWIFEQNPEDSFSEIAAPFRVDGDPAKGEVSGKDGECAQTAMVLCPVQVIHVD